jgi:hypothetical protein
MEKGATMRTSCNRVIAAAAAAAIALTSVSFSPATAAPVSKSQTVAANAPTDVSARRRGYNGGNRAALGAVLGVFGVIAGIAAADAARDRYRNHYGAYDPYYGGPDAPPPPAYYGGPYGYYR